MPLVLVRIDDRLIHGQVVEGWLRVIQASLIVVVSDEVAEDPFQVSLMGLAVPPDVRVVALKVSDAADFLKSDAVKDDRVMVLMAGVRAARRLVESGVEMATLNLGGLHEAAGRVALTPFLCLNADDRADIEFLLKKGVYVEVRALPNDEKRNVREFLNRSSAPEAKDIRPQ
ncbi:MAG TPA: PTS sugar transporter subunit IIB [Elusimicrobiota bacterium]|nr:PTS sugar transporter subunit IIB [Elusimicrobiota bacterium]